MNNKASPTEWCDDVTWSGLEDCLTMAVTNRLKAVDKAIFAMQRINKMLFADYIGGVHAEDLEEFTHDGLDGSDVEGLRIAVLLLGEMAAGRLEEVREDRHGCLEGLKERANV